MWQIYSIQNTILHSATYILYQEEGCEGWLVDCGDVDSILTFVNTHHLSLAGVLLTHTHYDHLYGLNELLKFYPNLVVFTNHAGKAALYDDTLNLSMCYDEEFVYQGDKIIELKDNQTFYIGGQKGVVYETPGHDNTCLTYQVANYLFTGDSYIPGHEVIVCWQNSNKEDAPKSVDRIKKMAHGMMTFPGHIM